MCVLQSDGVHLNAKETEPRKICDQVTWEEKSPVEFDSPANSVSQWDIFLDNCASESTFSAIANCSSLNRNFHNVESTHTKQRENDSHPNRAYQCIG